MRVLELAASWTVIGSLLACAFFPDLPEAAWERWQARKQSEERLSAHPGRVTMNDGAHLGVGAERALGTILSGQPQPEADEQETPEAVRARILAAADRGGEPTGYGDCADMAAGMILRTAEREPGIMNLPERELFDRVNALTEGKLSGLDLTGFMWGWAVNAARYTADLPPEPNPAIITIG